MATRPVFGHACLTDDRTDGRPAPPHPHRADLSPGKEPAAHVSQSARILVIDDDKGTCDILADVLRLRGHTVETATAGRAGLGLLAAHPPDVAIVEIKLPDISGLDLLAAIKASSPKTEVIFVTGFASLPTAIQAINGAAFAYFTKPFEMDHLLATVNKAVEKQRLTHALRVSEARYRGLVEGSIQGMLIHREFRIEFASPALATIFDCPSADELIGRDLRDFIAPQEWARIEGYAAAQRRGESVPPRYDLQGVRRDRSLIWVEAMVSVVAWEGAPATLMTVVDVSERKRTEEELRQAQKMEAVGRLAGGVAHDFNNLLTVIAGRSHFLAHRLGPEDPSRRDVELIQKSAERAAQLTRQLLAFSRKQILEPQLVDLSVIATGIEPILRRLIGEDMHLSVTSREGLGRVKADPGQVEQVILNLAINARDAMPRGGRLAIETANVELDESSAGHLTEVIPGPYVMLAVSDTGIGMDAATQARLFEPFFTTKEPGKGTGLGLATVYGIVKQSGGHVAVHSALGRGSTFKVYLPRLEGAVDGDQRVHVAAPASRGSETVLLVEDEPELRTLAREILAAWGYTVLHSGDSTQAFGLAERHNGSIHLLLTDVVMPGMSGREVADRLLSTRPDMKVLFMSGYTDSAIVHHGVLDPGTPFLPKPFTPDALVRKVREVLDRPRGQ
jgi:two-component system cell cycle sensor histidine kinase/response regulator CckA